MEKKMNCEKVRKELSSYLDNEVDIVQKSIIKEHLEKCRVCSYQLRQLKQIQNIMQKIPLQKPEPGFYERLSSRLSEKKVSLRERLFGWEYSWRLSPSFAGKIIVAASFVLILSISLLYFWRSSSIPEVNIDIFQQEYISSRMGSFAGESVLPVLLEIK